MYQFPVCFPPGFDLTLARELAYLVEQAYESCSPDTRMPNIVFAPPPPALEHLAAAYADVSAIEGTILIRPRLWNRIVRYLRFPSVLVPAKKIVEPFGFVARRDDLGFLVFRGSKSRADWWEDLHMEQSPVPDEMLPKASTADWTGASVEAGVLTLYQTLRERVLHCVRRYAPPMRLYVTGHSLGACLAKLAVPDLIANTAFKGEFKPVLYNFGQPRFVNRAFARAFAREACHAFRLVHTEDIVPSLMPAVPFLWFANRRHHLFYAHAGVPVDFTVTHGADVPDRQKLLMTNHAMSTYQAALWQDGRALGR